MFSTCCCVLLKLSADAESAPVAWILLKKAFQIGIVTLCALVFAWGLQYKLSLYAASTTTSMPAAKMIGGKSHVSLQDSTPVSEPRLRSVLSVSLIFLLIRYTSDQKQATYKSFRAARARFVRSLDLAHFSRFSFRPPPSRA